MGQGAVGRVGPGGGMGWGWRARGGPGWGVVREVGWVRVGGQRWGRAKITKFQGLSSASEASLAHWR